MQTDIHAPGETLSMLYKSTGRVKDGLLFQSGLQKVTAYEQGKYQGRSVKTQ